MGKSAKLATSTLVWTLLSHVPAYAFWPFSTSIEPAPPKINAAATPTPNPNAQSRIFVDVFIPIGRIQEDLENAAPQSESGRRGDPVGDPVVDDVLEWNIGRQPITIAGANGGLTATSVLAGTVRVHGNVRLIRGDIGKLLGKLNPTNIPFSVHADLAANVAATARPILRSDWRLDPNLDLAIDLAKAEIPIKHVGTISVRGQVRDDLAGKVAELRTKLNEKMANDAFIQEAATQAQKDLCQAHRFNAGNGLNGWVVVTPEAWEATQPRIDSEGVSIGLGLRAKTSVSFGQSSENPDCGNLAPLEIKAEQSEPRFDLAVPAEVVWADLSKWANSALKQQDREFSGTQFGQSYSISIGGIEFSSNGDRIQAKVGFSGKLGGFFGSTFDGMIYILAQPEIDAGGNILRFSNVEIDANTADNLSTIGLFGTILAPQAEKFFEEKAMIDLVELANKAKSQAEMALAEINASLAKEQAKVDGAVDSIALSRVLVTPQALKIDTIASGKIAVRLTK